MNFLSPVALLVLCSAMAAPLMADEQAPELTGCAAKRQGIINQIELAKSRGNQDQQAGLETALDEVTSHCTDASLRKERENKVLDAKHEVSRRQADLEKAMKKATPSGSTNARTSWQPPARNCRKRWTSWTSEH